MWPHSLPQQVRTTPMSQNPTSLSPWEFLAVPQSLLSLWVCVTFFHRNPGLPEKKDRREGSGANKLS